jgi:hypothetical protein
MWEINDMIRKRAQYYAEFQVIAANLDWNPLALRNAIQMGLSDKMRDTVTYSNMSEELPAFVTGCQR